MQGFELFFPAAVSRTKLVYAGIPSLALSYLELIDSDPTIWWKSLKHRHQELETARPVADQEHHADKVEYSHEHARHVQELKKRESLSVSSLPPFKLRLSKMTVFKQEQIFLEVQVVDLI